MPPHNPRAVAAVLCAAALCSALVAVAWNSSGGVEPASGVELASGRDVYSFAPDAGLPPLAAELSRTKRALSQELAEIPKLHPLAKVTGAAAPRPASAAGDYKLSGSIFSIKQARALQSFNVGVFRSHLGATESRLSPAVQTGVQSVAVARKQVDQVEAGADEQARAQPLAPSLIAARLRRDQTAYDTTQGQLRSAQQEMNAMAETMLQHHELEDAEEKKLKGKETDAEYAQNIAFDKNDMTKTKRLKAKIDALAKDSAVQHRALNADVAAMLALEKKDEQNKLSLQQRQAMVRLHAKAVAHAAPKGVKAARAAAVHAEGAVANATAKAKAAATVSGDAKHTVPSACLQLSVVKGVVSVPARCMHYELVKQVLGEAKERGGVQFRVV